MYKAILPVLLGIAITLLTFGEAQASCPKWRACREAKLAYWRKYYSTLYGVSLPSGGGGGGGGDQGGGGGGDDPPDPNADPPDPNADPPDPAEPAAGPDLDPNAPPPATPMAPADAEAGMPPAPPSDLPSMSDYDELDKAIEKLPQLNTRLNNIDAKLKENGDLLRELLSRIPKPADGDAESGDAPDDGNQQKDDGQQQKDKEKEGAGQKPGQNQKDDAAGKVDETQKDGQTQKK